MKKAPDIAGMALEFGRLIRKEMDTECANERSLSMHAAAFIGDKPGVTMKEFASLMNVSPSTATTFVDRLAKAGIAEREHDAGNRKVVRLRLTKDGAKAVARHAKTKERVLKKIFSRLSDADAAHLERIFSLLLERSPRSHGR